MSVKALDLFNAYNTGKLPKEGGYIISSFLKETSAYSRYEIVAYNGVKNIHVSADGMTFQSDGNKIFVLVEPDNYARKYIEPFRRESEDQIPHRFSELSVVTARNQTRVMVSAEPIMTYSAFTVLRPSGVNFSFIFFHRDDVMDSIHTFFHKTLNQEAKVPLSDARKAADSILDSLDRFSIWNSD